jgi:hypothetical protein
MTPDEFLSTRLHLKISHGMSPEASREFQDGLKTRGEESLTAPDHAAKISFAARKPLSSAPNTVPI